MTKHGAWSNDDHWPAEDFASLYCLVYCSHVTARVDEHSVAKIVAKSQENNARQGITGLLMLDDCFFLQWLEGPQEQIEMLMSKIRQDPHHVNILVLDEWEEVRERMFPDWAMERVDADHIREVLSGALAAAKEARTIQALRFLLHHLNAGTLATLTRY